MFFLLFSQFETGNHTHGQKWWILNTLQSPVSKRDEAICSCILFAYYLI